ncbi:hypothetical protein CJ030_MR3G012302 [Morella rubra]|uniref:Zinc knuckle CX2CX4HX4C domain-containing protein n=1 Tax=Morella rubra TaxID=262757 RepID=A0A6A1W5A4_9ROSI|nr:hypothetical protein CJ030_MR3G012302 [Morella rubra]
MSALLDGGPSKERLMSSFWVGELADLLAMQVHSSRPVLTHDFPANAKIHASHFFRVLVLLDTRKPLLPDYYQQRKDAEPCWVQLKYEKISDFCYACGRISHTQSFCELQFSSSDPNIHFSPKMKADGPGLEFRKWSIAAPMVDSPSDKARGMASPSSSGSPLLGLDTASPVQSLSILPPGRRPLFFPPKFSPPDGSAVVGNEGLACVQSSLTPGGDCGLFLRDTPPSLSLQNGYPSVPRDSSALSSLPGPLCPPGFTPSKSPKSGSFSSPSHLTSHLLGPAPMSPPLKPFESASDVTDALLTLP